MKIFVAATLLIATVGAVRGSGKGCCTPDQWQGSFASGAGYGGPNPRFISTVVQMFYDATNSRVAANASIYGKDKPEHYFIVTRDDKQGKDTKLANVLKGDGGEKGKMYIVDLQTNKCYIKDSSFKKFCIPDDAQFTGMFMFGAGNDTLKSKSFMMKRTTGPGSSVSSWITVTAQDCIPVGISMHGSVNGVGFVETSGYTNLKLSIDDPSVFDVPAQCKKNANTSAIPEGIYDLHNVFSL